MTHYFVYDKKKCAVVMLTTWLEIAEHVKSMEPDDRTIFVGRELVQ